MGGFAWLPKEDNLLRKKYRKLGPTECFKLLPKRTRESIQSRARHLGLTIEGRRCGQNIKPNSWTDEELEVVRNNYKDIGPKELHKLLPKRTPIAIRDTARFLGLTIIGKKWKKFETAWSDGEVAILKQSYLKVSPKRLSELLPRRTLNAIHTRARILKISDPTRQRRWSPGIRPAEPDVEASEKYGKSIYRFYLVGNERFALIEKRDLKKISQYRWYLLRTKKTDYAAAAVGKTLLMHRFIMKAGPHEEVDHRNWNGLDNVRKNLRRCTRSQNMQNRQRVNPFRGVQWHHKGSKPWVARIRANNKVIELGYFPSAEIASKAVNKAIKKYHGKFGVPNRI